MTELTGEIVKVPRSDTGAGHTTWSVVLTDGRRFPGHQTAYEARRALRELLGS